MPALYSTLHWRGRTLTGSSLWLNCLLSSREFFLVKLCVGFLNVSIPHTIIWIVICCLQMTQQPICIDSDHVNAVLNFFTVIAEIIEHELSEWRTWMNSANKNEKHPSHFMYSALLFMSATLEMPVFCLRPLSASDGNMMKIFRSKPSLQEQDHSWQDWDMLQGQDQTYWVCESQHY